MFRRTWTPAVIEGSNNESKIEIYDFGVYCGELIGDNWTCWEILSRTKNEAGDIVEELRKMPQDWVPFEEFTRETYLGTSTTDRIRIRGWSILTVEIPSEKLPSHPPKVERVVKQPPRRQQAPRQRQAPRRQQAPRQPQQAGPRTTAAKAVYNITQMKPPHRVAQVDQWTPLVNLVAPV